MLYRLYVRGLPDKLPKEDLKRNLYMLFATYGVILDVVALKTTKMRGQAHIVFRDLDASTQAMRALQGYTFFGKDMVCGLLRVISSHEKGAKLMTANRLRKVKVRHDSEAGRIVQDARAGARRRVGADYSTGRCRFRRCPSKGSTRERARRRKGTEAWT
jgi:RNA recognition motif-containing protein